MLIVCSCTFKHGTDKYIKDEIRSVSVGEGEYFCGNGWATKYTERVEQPQETITTDTALDIHSHTHTVGDSLNG